ncbi:hypothetical protein BT67DRAFT_284719 [Trichocladium antarcticum]|uniref:Uncharacterized protein n=1 Tax=Trichocladium antarcticum TaxID=1450529 RepID=A0AAN6ZEU7_9PEZI|nr:hypothetical protein BT67DRAFT_284719 [Trichocladium antarcticum]
MWSLTLPACPPFQLALPLASQPQHPRLSPRTGHPNSQGSSPAGATLFSFQLLFRTVLLARTSAKRSDLPFDFPLLLLFCLEQILNQERDSIPHR